MAKTKNQAGLSFAALKSHLARGKTAPVYLIAGRENFLADEAARAIAEAVEARGGEFSRTFHHGDQVDLATVLDDVRTLNLFSPTRVVKVAPADRFVQKYGDGLAAYVSAPAENGCLLLVVDKVDARRKLTKAVQEAGGVVVCNRPYERDIVPWITARAKAMGRAIDSAGAAALAEFLGTDLAALASELEKLATYIGARKKITADDVEAVSLRDRGRQIYELTDAIGRRQPAKALAVLQGLLEDGAKESGVLYNVARHLRRLWAAKELISKGEDQRAAAHSLGVQYFVDQFLAQVESFSARELSRSCSALLRCESTLKSSAVDDRGKRMVLETTFIRLMKERDKAAAGAS